MEEEKGTTSDGSPSTKKRNSPSFLIMSGIILLLIAALVITGIQYRKTVLASRTAPEIRLELAEGPDLTESGEYRCVVLAVVSGNPTPKVTFSRDDSLGEAGENQVIIFLNPGESITLTAAAVNSLGKQEAVLELSAETEPADEADPGEDAADGEGSEADGDGEDDAEEPSVNHNPTITGITFPTLFTDTEYSFTAEASDSDGDSLSCHWEITGAGSAATATGNPMVFTTPDHMGSLTITVTVEDGRGGEAVHSQEATINPVLTLTPIPEETGYIVKEYAIGTGEVLVGDGNTGHMIRGFISFDANFDIPVPFTVYKAVLRLSNPDVSGTPSDFHNDDLGMWVGMVYWGAGQLELPYYKLDGTPIQNFTDYDITLTSVMGESSEGLARQIQARLSAGTDRLQFRLHFAKEFSNGGLFDTVEYQPADIDLQVYLLIEE